MERLSLTTTRTRSGPQFRREMTVTDDLAEVNALPVCYGDTFKLLVSVFATPTHVDRDRERERRRAYYPTRSPPPFRGEGVYDPDGETRMQCV
jgi:hypothetical protein